MDVKRGGDDRLHVSLGPVDRWVVGIAATLLVAMCAWIATSFAGRLDQIDQRMASVAVQQAVTSSQLTTLSAQLADIPSLSRQMAEIRVQTQRNSDDIKELRTVRGLK